MAHERLLRTQPLSPVPTQAAPLSQTQRMQAASAPNPTPMPSASPVPNTQPIPRPAPRLEARPASPEQRSRSLFRERALLAHSSGEAAAEPLRIAPIWTRWTILSGALLVVGALLTAFFVRVELVATGRGILQAAGPPRIVAAQQLLESTELPLDAVAQNVGFASAIAMRPHFRLVVGVSPTQYRKAFRRSEVDQWPSTRRQAAPTATP